MLPLLLAAMTVADHVSADVEAGGGVQTSTTADAASATPSGKAQVGYTFGERATGIAPHLALRGRLDTTGFAQAALGAGFLHRSSDRAFTLKLMLIGGITEFPIVGSSVIAMTGGELSMANAFGDLRSFEVSGTLGSAGVFPGHSGDVIDSNTATITSYRWIGIEGWGRLAATYYVSRDLGIGVGPFFAVTLASVRRDTVSPFLVDSTRPTDVYAVFGLQMVLAK
jgi:hypothetical protein